MSSFFVHVHRVSITSWYRDCILVLFCVTATTTTTTTTTTTSSSLCLSVFSGDVSCSACSRSVQADTATTPWPAGGDEIDRWWLREGGVQTSQRCRATVCAHFHEWVGGKLVDCYLFSKQRYIQYMVSEQGGKVHMILATALNRTHILVFAAVNAEKCPRTNI